MLTGKSGHPSPATPNAGLGPAAPQFVSSKILDQNTAAEISAKPEAVGYKNEKGAFPRGKAPKKQGP